MIRGSDLRDVAKKKNYHVVDAPVGMADREDSVLVSHIANHSRYDRNEAYDSPPSSILSKSPAG